MDLKSWKTTLSSCITAVAGFVLFSPELFDGHPVIVELAKYIGIGGLVSFGINSRDNKVSDEQADAGRTHPPVIEDIAIIRAALADEQARVADLPAAHHEAIPDTARPVPGPQGPPGKTGPQGEKGEQGPKGIGLV